MSYTLIQFHAVGRKGRYEPIAFTTYDDLLTAFNEGMQMHKKLSSPYAGFVVKDSQGNTLHRVRKGFEK